MDRHIRLVNMDMNETISKLFGILAELHTHTRARAIAKYTLYQINAIIMIWDVSVHILFEW